MNVNRKDCQDRYDRIKNIQERIYQAIADLEEAWCTDMISTEEAASKIGALWDLKTRYGIEKVTMEAEFKKILTGIENG